MFENVKRWISIFRFFIRKNLNISSLSSYKPSLGFKLTLTCPYSQSMIKKKNLIFVKKYL